MTDHDDVSGVALPSSSAEAECAAMRMALARVRDAHVRDYRHIEEGRCPDPDHHERRAAGCYLCGLLVTIDAALSGTAGAAMLHVCQMMCGRYAAHKCQRSESIDFDWRWAVRDMLAKPSAYPYLAFCATRRVVTRLVDALNAVDEPRGRKS